MWYKQTADNRLFPELEWEKPERKDQSGRLLIVGGNLHGFAAPAKAYEVSLNEDIGSLRLALPDSLRRTLGPLWTDAIFCPSTISGSFSKEASDLILQNMLWADAVLLAGDFGRNSETALVLENIAKTVNTYVCVTKDGLDYFLHIPDDLLKREHTLVVGSFAQLQKMMAKCSHPTPITYSMQLTTIVQILEEFSMWSKASLITKFNEFYIGAHNGDIITMPAAEKEEIWRVPTASRLIVKAQHHPTKLFEAITDSLY